MRRFLLSLIAACLVLVLVLAALVTHAMRPPHQPVVSQHVPISTVPAQPQGTQEPAQGNLASPQPATQPSLQTRPVDVAQAFFYKPPRDTTTPQQIAERADLVILTRRDERYREQLRAAGYDGLVLQYVLANEVNGPPGLLDSSAPCDEEFVPWSNQVAYDPGDFCRYIHPNEDWFLHNQAGERLYGQQGDNNERWFYFFNPASRGWQDFMISRLKRFLEGDSVAEPLGYDGIFLDNVALRAAKIQQYLPNSDGSVQEFATDEAYRAAWVQFLQRLSTELRPQWPIWANMIDDPQDAAIWEDYLPFLDGVMNESFATGWPWSDPHSVTEWEASLARAEQALALERGFIAQSQGSDANLQPFALASYLLIADGQRTYFRYSQRSDYSNWYQFENYALELGIPQGPRQRQPDGTWRRDFARGMVLVDPEQRTGEIRLTEE